MYSRNSVKNPRYSPPPGYAGNTFADEGEVKHHLPVDEVERPSRIQDEIKPEPPQPVEHKQPEKQKDHDIFEELIGLLKGKWGSEELIILAVMLLIAQDGIGVEVLILALLLIAG